MTNRSCTCHPDDNPPVPCPQKFALSECKAAAPAPDDARDAARYRWLRGNYSESLALAQTIQMFTPDELDAAIDAAMKEGK